ncbi:MAG TPA: hypothetical protein VD907_01950 [Verrucomicrobiae bacterium]|nr:hypothetical protein [Verrucomicrobiae bacterium]
MGTQSISGKFFRVSGDEVKFFENESYARMGRESWRVGGFEVDINPLTPEIQDCLDDDERNGKLDRVAMVLVGPVEALQLFVEGCLKVSHFSKAAEHADCIDVPEVQILGRQLTVRIKKNYPRVATADRQGKEL